MLINKLNLFHYNTIGVKFIYPHTLIKHYIRPYNTKADTEHINNAQIPKFIDFINQDIRYKKPKKQIKFIFNNMGNNLLPEPNNITQNEHALQIATIAMNNTDNYNKHLIIAALLHDINHLMPGTGEPAHENLNDYPTSQPMMNGYNFLKYLNLPINIIEPIRLQQLGAAKKYLCATDINYYNKLNESSKFSLELLGGIFNEQECEIFLNNKYYKDSIKIQLWNDMSKKKNVVTEDLDFFMSIFNDNFIFYNGWIKTNRGAYRNTNYKESEQFVF